MWEADSAPDVIDQENPKRQTVTVKYLRKPGKTVRDFPTLNVRS